MWSTKVGPGGLGGGVEFGTATDDDPIYVAEGNMYALDAHTGDVLWSFASGGSVFSAPAVVHGMLLWGSGYTRNGACPDGFNSCVTNNKLYAFSLP